MQFVLHRNILDTWTLTQAVIFHFQFPFPFGRTWHPPAGCVTWVYSTRTHTHIHTHGRRSKETRDKRQRDHDEKKASVMCVLPEWIARKKAASRSTKRKKRGEKKKKAEVRGRETVAALWAPQTERGGSVAICLFFFLFFFSHHLPPRVSHLLN